MRRTLGLILVMSLLLSCASTQTEKSPEETPIYISSLGELKMRVAYQEPSQVLEKYEQQLKYRLNEPKQDFLHELNLAGLSLMAGRPQKSRKHLIRSAQYIDWQNYTSILNEASEVILLKSIRERYPLQPQEYVMINYLSILTYVYENDWSNALVGVRALHESLKRMEQSFPGVSIRSLAYFYFFAGYIYEQNGLFDDARIDYERVKALKPDWQLLDLHLWRAYEMSGSTEKAQEYAKRLGYDKLPAPQRRKIAQFFPLKVMMWQHIGWKGSPDFRLSDIHIERRKKDGDLEIWGYDKYFTAFERNELDREVAQLLPRKTDNPAYLLHVNPYSISYMVLGTIFSAYADALGFNSKPQFVVDSFDFMPKAVSILYTNACEADDAKCEFKTYSMIQIPEHILRRKNLMIVQCDESSRTIPFK